MTKGIQLAITCCCLMMATTLVAQEPEILSAKRRQEVIPPAKVAPAMPVSRQWFDERIDPIQRERRLIREARAAEAQRIAARNAQKKPSMPIQAGNTSVENWSPYQDRALDARNLSFPMSKSTIRRNETKKAQMQQMKNMKK